MDLAEPLAPGAICVARVLHPRTGSTSDRHKGHALA